MQTASSRDLPPFWLLLLAGWLPVLLGTAVATLPVVGEKSYVVYRAFFLIGCLAVSLPLALGLRMLWNRRASWLTYTAVMLPLTYVLALASTFASFWCAVHFGGMDEPLTWRSIFGSVSSAWFALMAFGAVHLGIAYYYVVREARMHTLAATSLAREAELRALRYQLHPHFLFNTLNAISTLVVDGQTQDATRMIARLGDFLRATLDGAGTHEVTLADELSLTEHYLDIEKVRLGDRLEIAIKIGPDTLQAAVPYLLLQPLVENAIRHGIAPRKAGGRLEIDVARAGERLRIDLRNDGIPGAKPVGSPSAVGLSNVRARLERLYEENHRFALDFAADGSCRVGIDLPFRRLLVAEASPA
jgi:two-component system, LytTR family, sensor histidine kinase AlgZ